MESTANPSRTLLQEIEVELKALGREEWRKAREKMKSCLRQHLSGQTVWVFGSILHPERFNEFSDIDIAIEDFPPGLSLYALTSLLEESLGRPVDIVDLRVSRLRTKILEQGEAWIV